MNPWAVTTGKVFGAVAAVQDKGFSFRGLGQLPLEGPGFARKDQGRQPGNFCQFIGQQMFIRPWLLLINRK
jgi:hypothetical protein